MSQSMILDYYANNVPREWRRLVKNAYRRLELETTLFFLEKYLPPGGLVLDAGGGPGRYTLELTRRGYAVVLLDLTPENLAFAQRRLRRAGLYKQVGGIVQGSIVEMPEFAEHTFDAVVCTGGPLSHVLDAGDRQRAAAELVRVAKPGAPIFVSVMSRLSVLIVVLTLAQHEITMPHFNQLRDTGDYFGGHGFTACHFFLPEEFRALFAGLAVQVLEMAGMQGINAHQLRALLKVAKDAQAWQIWRETHLLTCTHPAAVGISEHMLLVCRKNGGG